jgi:hypothetical protein
MAVLTAIVLSANTPAQASSDSGWIYTVGSGGKAYFDADVSGYAGQERLTVCDIKADGLGVTAWVWRTDIENGQTQTVSVGGNGTCAYIQSNMFTEETPLALQVCQYKGTALSNCRSYEGFTA